MFSLYHCRPNQQQLTTVSYMVRKSNTDRVDWMVNIYMLSNYMSPSASWMPGMSWSPGASYPPEPVPPFKLWFISGNIAKCFGCNPMVSGVC